MYSTGLLLISLAAASCGGSGGQSKQSSQAPFFVEPNPQAPLIMPGSSQPLLITVLPLIGVGWNGIVNVTITGPSGVTVSPSTFSVNTTQSDGNTVTLAATNPLASGVYTLTVTGTSAGMTATALLEVAVIQPPPVPTALQANILYSFTPQEANPAGSLVADSAGNLYGVAGEEIFKLSYTNGSWQESVLYTFPLLNTGPEPYGSLIIDSLGNLYGVTALGGSIGSTNCGPQGCGMVYELSPTASGWQPTTLYSFLGATDGTEPGPGLVMDNSGNIYGTTRYGGYSAGPCINGGCGTVFALTPSQGGWQHTVIYSFQGSTQGSTPNTAMIMDQQGNLYGTTEGEGYQSSGLGGNATCMNGCGTVFELTKSAGGWQEQTIYSFVGLGTDGADPTGVVMDSAGNLYGATSIGGFTNLQCNGSTGNVYELSPGGSGWNITQLYYFSGCDFGWGPLNLIRDSSGNLYGAAQGGVTGCVSGQGCGVVFKLSQTEQGWEMTEVDDFPGAAGGDTPWAVALVGGKLYGVTEFGGASSVGTVFQITP
jgi:uncharacterized repeat protein (TIGR03803 family)